MNVKISKISHYFIYTPPLYIPNLFQEARSYLKNYLQELQSYRLGNSKNSAFLNLTLPQKPQ